MGHGTPIPDPEGLIPHGLVSDTSDKVSSEQFHIPADTPSIKLDSHENPINWPASKKWSATIVIVLMTATITFSSSIHASAIGGVSKEFGCSRTVATLGVTTFLLGFATGPLLFAPLSEVWGRSLVFRITLGLFFCFNLGCALAPNVAGLLVLRFLCGFFGSPTGKLFTIILGNWTMESNSL
jgi:MFS family permease